MSDKVKTKIGLIGDIHGNLEALMAVLDKAKELEVTHYVCIGDIVGYNANPKECLDIVRDLKPIACIMGNHDEYVATNHDLLGFNFQAAKAVEWTRKQLSDDDKKWLRSLKYKLPVRIAGTDMEPFVIVHGTLDNPEAWGYIFTRLQAEASMENQMPFKICFFGHSHVPLFFMKEDGDTKGFYYPEDSPVEVLPNVKYTFNIGSIGQPRDGDPRAAFTVYTPSDNAVQLYRVDYDIETCQAKIRDAGLPEKLATRLAEGR